MLRTLLTKLGVRSPTRTPLINNGGIDDDAGTDAGTDDAGTDAGSDAGTDAGNDASNTTDKPLILGKCLNGCGRYELGTGTCCSFCRPHGDQLDGHHSLICRYDHGATDTVVGVRLSYYDPRLRADVAIPVTVAILKKVPHRMAGHLRQLLSETFPRVRSRFNLGCDLDERLKPGRLHEGNLVYIRGYVVDLRKGLHEFLLRFVAQNEIPEDQVDVEPCVRSREYNLYSTGLKRGGLKGLAENGWLLRMDDTCLDHTVIVEHG